MGHHIIKTLSEICSEAESTLDFLDAPKGSLIKEAESWLDESVTVVAHKVSVKNYNVIMVVRAIETGSLRHYFSVMRFFVVGKQWRTSVDLQDKLEGETLQYLLNRFE